MATSLAGSRSIGAGSPARRYQGDNIWQDVILGFEGYNEALTDTVEHGQSDEFVAHGTVSGLTPLTMHFEYVAADREWIARPYIAELPDTLAQGIEEAERGETADLGSFAQYADDEPEDHERGAHHPSHY